MDKEYFLKYIHDGEIFIKESEWYAIKKTFSKEEIKDALANAIFENVKFPLRKYTETDVSYDFNNLLKSDDVKTYYSEYSLKEDYKYSKNNIYIQGSNNGLVASNNFQQANRMMAFHKSYHVVPYDIFKSVKYLKSLCRFLFLCKEVSNAQLLSAISSNFYIASQFRPSVAKYIYNKFNSKDVLDFSSGWGDRLCGFYASNAESYFGIDPNTSVYKDYFKQIEFYERFVHKKTHIENLPAEDVDFKDFMFDTIFTSPPYFDIEMYCDEDTQSYKRYTSVDVWLDKFMYKVIKNITDHLKDDGFLILNIADLKRDKIKICDKMNDYIGSMTDMKYLGCIGMRMNVRVGKNMMEQNQVFCEPVWIWQKSKQPTTLDNIFKYQIEDW